MIEFSCDHCSEEFARRDSLARHKVRKTPCNPGMVNGDSRSFTEKRKHIDGDSQQSSKRLKEDRASQKRINSMDDEEISTILDDEIPCFDGDEFSGKKPKSRDTLYRMMQMLNIPDHRWENIATDILDTDQKDFSMWIDEDEDGSGESRDEEDAPLNESEIEELCKRFKLLQYDLIYKGHRENVSELLDILNVLLEAGLISRADYIKKTNKVKDL